MPGSRGCDPMMGRRLPRRTAHSRSEEGRTMAKADSAAPIRVIEATPAYWRVVFDYPPFNILDATIFEGLPHLVGRGRALEIILGANDFDGDTAERYGYVNRALPDSELDGFVDALSRRIASFDRRAIAAAKSLVNQVSLPSTDRLLDAITSFGTALTWPETQQRVQAVLKRGLQQDADYEKRWTDELATLLET